MLPTALPDLHRKFSGSPNDEWAFTGTRSVNRWTHGYHRYPAKFIPQLVKKIIESYATRDAIVADVFAGCGTTLVESKVHGIKSIGVDINPVAQMITRAKINPVDPKVLDFESAWLISRTKYYSSNEKYIEDNHPRIDYWFNPEEKNKIAYLFNLISECTDPDVSTFFLCALSNILKNCSKWLQSSTKPQLDKNKVPKEPFESFNSQIKMMIKKNRQYHEELNKRGWVNIDCEILLSDARKTGLSDSSIDIIITSPPYVTSYEYADIHQLTGYWFNYFSDIISFRKDFIGTFYSNNKRLDTFSEIAKQIVLKLEEKDKKFSREVANYFRDMYDCKSSA